MWTSRPAIRGVAAMALALLAVAAVAGAAASAGDKAAQGDAGQAKRAEATIEPKALEILKAMSAKLGGAKTLTFDAVATYESPSRYGAPLAYNTMSQVSLQRPDKLKVIRTADGPPSEFYYDGKTMMAFAPEENLVAVAEAPATIDAMLARLYDVSGTYFPFCDLIVSDPYADLSKNLTLAFYVGQSKVVDGTTTDIVAYETNGVFIQLWVGADDKLPRRARAVYYDDAQRLRHAVDVFNWKLDKPMEEQDFVSAKAAGAAKIAFENPKTRRAAAEAAPAAAPAGKSK